MAPISHNELAGKFKEYADIFPDKDPVSLFEEWSLAENVSGLDKYEVWRAARKLLPRKTIVINENSDEAARVMVVLDIVLRADLEQLHRMLENRQNNLVKPP